MRLLGWVGVLALMLSCQQDPLRSYPESVRQGQPPQTKPEYEKPIPSDSIRIDAPDVMAFVEQETQVFKLGVRVLIDGYSASLSVKNLRNFVGASFNAQTGEFRWSPPRGWVSGQQSYSVSDLALEVVATSKEPKRPPLLAQKIVKVLVFKSRTGPAQLVSAELLVRVFPRLCDPSGNCLGERPAQNIIAGGPYDLKLKVNSSGEPKIFFMPLRASGDESFNLGLVAKVAQVSQIEEDQWLILIELNVPELPLGPTAAIRMGYFDASKQDVVELVELSWPLEDISSYLGVRVEYEGNSNELIIPAGESGQWAFRLKFDRPQPLLESELWLVEGMPQGFKVNCEPYENGEIRCVVSSDGTAPEGEFKPTLTFEVGHASWGLRNMGITLRLRVAKTISNKSS